MTWFWSVRKQIHNVPSHLGLFFGSTLCLWNSSMTLCAEVAPPMILPVASFYVNTPQFIWSYQVLDYSHERSWTCQLVHIDLEWLDRWIRTFLALVGILQRFPKWWAHFTWGASECKSSVPQYLHQEFSFFSL